MKRRIMALLLAATLVFQGVSTVPVFANEASVEIPTEGVENLTEGEEGASVTIPAGETKWFSFEPTVGTKYTINTVDTTVTKTLYDADGVQIAKDEWGYGIMRWLDASTTYYVAVASAEEVSTTLSVVGDDFAAVAKNANVALQKDQQVTLEVIAYAKEGAVTYQWSDNNGPIEGETESTLTLTGALGMSANYTCDVTNGDNTTSVYFTVDYRDVVGTLVLNDTEGVSATYTRWNEEKYFKFVPTESRNHAFYAVGDMSLGVQILDEDFEALPNASNYGNDNGFYIEQELVAGNTYYVCATSNGAGNTTVYVNDAKFTVKAENNATDITIPYGDENTKDLNVVVNNETGNATEYAWSSMDETGAYVPMDNATGTLTLNGNVANQNTYKCVVTAGTESKEVVFNVTVDTELEVEATNPIAYAEDGEEITLNATATGLKEPITYAWSYYNENYQEVVIPEATGSSYTFTHEAGGADSYLVTVKDGHDETYTSFTIREVDARFTLGDTIKLDASLAETGDEVIYKFVAPATATYKFASESNGYPQMAIYDTQSSYPIFESQSIDDPWDWNNPNPNLNFNNTVDLTKGQTYYMHFRLQQTDENGAVIKTSVTDVDIADCTVTVADTTYNGEVQTPEVTVKLGNYVFEKDTDYVVEYYYMDIHPKTGMPAEFPGGVAIGTGYVRINEPMETSGALTIWPPVEMEYTIGKTSLANATVVVKDVVYDGTAKTPAIESVKIGDLELTTDDYTVEYTNNVAAGTATVTLKAAEDSEYYTGSVVKNFKIVAASINGATVTLDKTSYTYDGAAKTPAVTVKVGNVTLKANTDYTVSYSNNVAAGKATVTVTGKGNYAGTASATYTINAASINGATVTVDPTSYTYDGTAKVPAVTVKVGNVTLKAGTDYTVAVANNTNKGTATVVVTGKGNYAGTASATYTINAASIANATVTIASVKYTGKALKPAVTVKVGNVTLKEGTDYTVKYSNNKNIGKGKVTITGIGNYTGSLSKTFTIAAKKGDKFTVKSYTYKITGSSTVAFAGVVKSKVSKTTTVKVADTVKIGGKTFKVTSIVDNALKNNKKVKKVTIGKNVTTIGKSAFEGCTKLATVTIGAKVTKISDKAFKKCTALKKITIPAKVKTIGKEAFRDAKNLKTITIKSTVLKTVGKNAFKSINKKATIKVPSKKLSSYKKVLKGKGQAKTVKIKK